MFTPNFLAGAATHLYEGRMASSGRSSRAPDSLFV